MSNEQKPAASTLDRKVYWAKRDTLEENIANGEQVIVSTLPGDSCAEFLPKWQEGLAILRERLIALGEPPGPRVREDDGLASDRRERIATVALAGLLANPNLSSPSFAKYALREADDLIAALDAEDSEP